MTKYIKETIETTSLGISYSDGFAPLSEPELELELEAKRRVSESNNQALANTAWAFAKVGRLDEELFAALA